LGVQWLLGAVLSRKKGCAEAAGDFTSHPNRHVAGSLPALQIGTEIRFMAPKQRLQTRIRQGIGDQSRRALTLVEMLVAVTVTLIMLFAVLKLAQTIGASASQGRAIIELAGEIRQTGTRLQADLDKRTATALSWLDSGAGQGYFEYSEGPMRDGNVGTGNPIGLMGDPDDWLAFTATAMDGEPFTGVINGTVQTSPTAEIIWWLRFNPLVDDANRSGEWEPGETKTLHRRVLLIRPDINPGIANGSIQTFQSTNDLSVRPGPSGNLVANSLNDLTLRENRFMYSPLPPPSGSPILFPFVVDRTRVFQVKLPNAGQDAARLLGDAEGEDIVLGRVLSFDVKAFDPMAPVRAAGNYGLVPGDPGWAGASGNNVGLGAFVDLNYNGEAAQLGAAGRVSYFSGVPMFQSQIPADQPCYDTWSMSYERDGIDQDRDGLIDEGTDGIDNDGNGMVDDPAEFETSPPYPVPLRGIKVIIRAYEPDSRQVRQSSIVSDLMPE